MPTMWETFTTDLLVKTGTRSVVGLAHPTSKIIKHIRKLHLLDRPDVAEEEDQLPQLIAAIPRDQLCGFKSGNGVSTGSLQLLLQMHTRLKDFNVPGDEILQLLQSPWTGRSLSGLTRMDILLDRLTPDGAQKVWAHIPKLKYVRLMRTSNSALTPNSLQEGHFSSDAQTATSQNEAQDTSTSSPPSLQLIRLYIDNMVLPSTFSTMFQRIDIIALNELILNGTKGVVKLLKAMCSVF
jgi:hypothetical protein